MVGDVDVPCSSYCIDVRPSPNTKRYDTSNETNSEETKKISFLFRDVMGLSRKLFRVLLLYMTGPQAASAFEHNSATLIFIIPVCMICDAARV